MSGFVFRRGRRTCWCAGLVGSEPRGAGVESGAEVSERVSRWRPRTGLAVLLAVDARGPGLVLFTISQGARVAPKPWS